MTDDATTTDDRTENLPSVSEGDTVRVTYTSGQTDTEQIREGSVEEVHTNGFWFDHGDEGYLTSVRDHGRYTVDVSTLTPDHRGEWGHASKLNLRHNDPSEVDVEVVDRSGDEPDVATDGGEDLTLDPTEFMAVVGVEYDDGTPGTDGSGGIRSGLGEAEARDLAVILLRGVDEAPLQSDRSREIVDELLGTLDNATLAAE